MTKEEKQKAIDAIKISAPFMAVTQEEFNDYIQTLNKIMDWLEQEPCDKCVYSTSEGCQYDDITETIPPFDDCISRQAVLDLINADWKYEGLEEPINSLPPVTPQPKMGIG